jgi:hypothetical protein
MAMVRGSLCPSLLIKAEVLRYPRLFIVDGIISLPIAVAGYFMLPDVPEISRALYLSKEVEYPL